MAEKLTEELTVKLSPSGKRFIAMRSKQQGMESSAEYVRSLIDMDQKKASADFNLLAEALGHNAIKGNEETSDLPILHLPLPIYGLPAAALQPARDAGFTEFHLYQTFTEGRKMILNAILVAAPVILCGWLEYRAEQRRWKK